MLSLCLPFRLSPLHDSSRSESLQRVASSDELRSCQSSGLASVLSVAQYRCFC